MSPSRLAAAFIGEVENSVDAGLRKDVFDAIVRRLVPGRSLDKDSRRFLSAVLSNIFYSFDRDRVDSAVAEELAAAVALVGDGTMRDRLLSGWTLFEDGGGGLTHWQLARMIRAGFTLLVAITHDDSDYLTAAEQRCVDDASEARADEIFDALSLGRANRMGFKEFVQWFSESGKFTTPWAALAIASPPVV
jgi:hypothetical protein